MDCFSPASTPARIRPRKRAAGRMSAGRRRVRRVQAEVLSHLELHPIDFSQKPRDRQAKVGGIRLRDSKMRDLFLEVPDSLEHRVQLLVGCDHDAPRSISPTPLRRPSRLTCQYSTAACSPSKAAIRLSQNTLAPKCASAARRSNSSRASPVVAETSKLSAIRRNTSTSFGSDLAVTNEPNTTIRARHPVASATE